MTASDKYDTQLGPEAYSGSLTNIPHYYGDLARGLLVAAAALSLLASPLFADSVSSQYPYLIAGAFAAVVAAGLTNPKKRWSLIADVIVASIGMIAYASWAFAGYDSINMIAFMLRMLIALMFLFALYFSFKTVRAFFLHEIGKGRPFTDFNGDRN